MPRNNKVYLIFVDILGFGPLAKEIAEKKDIETRDVRKKFINTIERKLEQAGKENLLIGIAPGRDDWILAVGSKQKVFLVLSKILDHYTGYKDYETVPLEIAIGIAEYDKWARLDGNKIICEDDTIDYLKSNIIGEYHRWYKQNNNNESVKETFIINTISFFKELPISDQNICKKISYDDGQFYYLSKSIIEKERKITDFLKEIRQKRSDFSGALIDMIFIPPTGYREIKKTLEKDRIVFITGTAGYGKTYAAIRLLWEYYNQDYTPRWIPGKEETERRNVRDKLAHIETQLEEGHIIYFEDPFGKTKYERRDDLKERINHIISSVKNKEDVYVIITSRKDVFEEFEKESYSVEEINKFEQELNILHPAYNNHKRKEILEKWAVEKGCRWLEEIELKNFVFKLIELKNNLPTPLSIHDFVESTIHTTNMDELRKEVSRYSGSSEKAFADEIIGLYEFGRKDRVLFLSFIYISEQFEANFIKSEYDKMKDENFEDFKSILYEEYRVKERIFNNGKYLEFSHPSYFGSIKYLIKHPGCKKIFWEVSNNLLNHDYRYVQWGTAEALGKIGDSQAVQFLLETLKDPYWSVRRASAQALGEIGDVGAVQPLIGALNDEDWSVRRTSVQALGKIGCIEAVDPLICTLKDKDWGVRKVSAEALGKIGDSKAVQPLIQSLNDEDWGVQSRAAESLGKIGDPKALLPLIHTLRDLDLDVRRKAAEAIEKIGKNAVKSLAEILKDPDPFIRRRAAEAIEKIGKNAVEPLAEIIVDLDVDARRRVAGTLGKIGDPRATQLLIESLKDQDKGVRGEAARALGEIGDIGAVQPLIQTLEDPYATVRRAIVESLGEIGDSQVVQPLILSLKDPDMGVRRAVVEALEKIGDWRAVQPLIRSLEDPDNGVRRASARALGEIGDVEAVPPLIGALNDRDWTIRRAVVEALGEMGDLDAVQPLILSLKDPYNSVRSRAVWALGRIGKPALESLFLTLKDSDIRMESIDALERIGDPSAVKPLADILKIRDKGVRRRAAEALGEIGDYHAVKPLINSLNDPYWTVRMAVVKALGEIGDSKAVYPLICILNDPDTDVRNEVVEALKKMKDSQAIYYYKKALNDENEFIRAAAKEALNEMKTSNKN